MLARPGSKNGCLHIRDDPGDTRLVLAELRRRCGLVARWSIHLGGGLRRNRAEPLEATNAESAGTGQSAWLITLLNSGPTACMLRGYPRLTALGADGKVLPFRIHYGGSAAVTNEQSVAVTIRPGGKAFVTFGKYRCDVGEKALVQEVTVILPDAATSVSLDLGALNTCLAYCGPGDPGSELAVSPVEPTEAKTRSH